LLVAAPTQARRVMADRGLAMRGGDEDHDTRVPLKDNTFMNKQQLGEQSTVTVLVASAFCCCFLFLSCVAAGCSFMFLLIWGVYILDNSDTAKTNSCEDSYHIWTFCLLNEIMGLLVSLCGCWEACKAYDNLKSDSSDEQKSASPGPYFYAKYGVTILGAFFFFFWGMVEWFSVSDGCITEYNNKYQALMVLFRASVVADAIILLVASSMFVFQRQPKAASASDVP